MNLQERTLEEAVAARATDIHIDPTSKGYLVRYRVDGKLRQGQQLDAPSGISLINQVKASVGIEPGTAFLPRGERLKVTVAGHPLDLRVTLVPCISGPKIAIRVLDPVNVVKAIPQLGLEPAERSKLEEWAHTLNGMILVTGPTSCGKTTTLYSLLHELAEESRHVVTVEDPVEYEIDGISQMQVDPRHHFDFAEGVKTALRLDPDCLMVGEIREPKAALESINAAIQGHVVMATLHSRDAVSAITRLRNFEVANHQIATALGVVINQRLIRKLCPACKKESGVSAEISAFFEKNRVAPPTVVFAASGCEQCRGTGYFGRTGLFEIWNLNETDYHLILRGADEQTIRARLMGNGQRFIYHDAAVKLNSGTTSFAEIRMLGLDLPWTD